MFADVSVRYLSCFGRRMHNSDGRASWPIWKKSAVLVLGFLVLAGVTVPQWKPVAKRFKWFVISTNIYQDVLRRTHLASGQISHTDFSAVPASQVPDYLQRINSTFEDYLRYGGLT